MMGSKNEESSQRRCQSCGAHFLGFICEHCGALSGVLSSPAEEQQALEEYRDFLAHSTEAGQVEMLKSGFMPTDSAVLIDAGLHCISFFKANDIWPARMDAAAARLDSIVIKLQLLPRDSEIRDALTRFERELDRYQRKAKADIFWGLLVFAVVGLVMFLIWKFR